MFAKYGGVHGVSLLELVAENRIEGDLWARAEFSGSEGCYAEVAKWNHDSQQWERYAFEKYFADEYDSALGIAKLAASVINSSGNVDHLGIIHSMPSYGQSGKSAGWGKSSKVSA